MYRGALILETYSQFKTSLKVQMPIFINVSEDNIIDIEIPHPKILTINI